MFLDEFPEFSRSALEALREPLETGSITIARAARRSEFPARFQLIAAMNPCPCGYLGSAAHRCRCSLEQLNRYRNRLSGPLMDRIDLHIEVPNLPAHDLLSTPAGESTASIRARCLDARALAMERQGKANQALVGQEIDRYAVLDDSCTQFLRVAAQRLGWSARGTHRTLKIARTIADLAGSAAITPAHAAEAMQYRHTTAPPPA